MAAPGGSQTTTACQICNSWGGDLRLKGCGCTVHARCLPLSLIVNGNSSTRSCPCCKASFEGLYLLPLSFDDLEESVRLRKSEASQRYLNKRPRDDEDLHIEAQYMVYSQGRNTVSSTLSDTDNSRTGRWTDEEVAFVEHLVVAFNKGELPLSQGVKLSSFLGDILLCKASRLTKKMKNAKLSTRSFEMSKDVQSKVLKKEDCHLLSVLQDRFIGSMQTKVAQLELKFNLVKQWRMYFSNLCIQIGCQVLDATDWITSIEEMERKASTVEEQMRVVRRKRMGLGTNQNIGHARMKSARSEPILHHDTGFQPNPTTSMHAMTNTNMIVSSSDPNLMNNHQRDLSDDLDTAIMSLYDSSATNFHNSFDDEKIAHPVSSRDPFLEAISQYMENSGLPFQHADVWVPSFTHGNGSQVQLLHAGHATRRDQGGALLNSFAGFGEFSKSFTFQPNQGLPGRVYAAGQAQWEFQLSNPAVFPRYRGAKAYGLRTATGIPITTPGVGRMVVVFYSSTKLMEDSTLVNRCAMDLASYSPAPKWKLVIEIGNCHIKHPKTLPSHSTTSQASASQAQGENPNGSIEQQIIALLGNEMPVGEADPGSNDLVQNVMAIRLLFLRSSQNRSAEENEWVELLKSSFVSYSKGNKRSSGELARLLATEFMCMKSPEGEIVNASALPRIPSQEQPQQQNSTQDGKDSIPTKAYRSTQLMPSSNSLPPMLPRGISGPPTRLRSVGGNSRSLNDIPNMRRTVSVSGIPPLPLANTDMTIQEQSSSFNDQPPSF